MAEEDLQAGETAADAAPSAEAQAEAAAEKQSFLQRSTKAYSLVSDILTPTRIAMVLGALLLAATGLFGGWDAATEAADEIPVIAVDTAFDAAPFELTVQQAYVVTELGSAFPASEDNRYLVVTLEARNTSDFPVSAGILMGAASIDVAGLASFDINGEPRIADPTVVRLEDSLVARTLQPDLPVQLALVWQQATTEAAPTEIELSVAKHTWRKSTLDIGSNWLDPAPAATVDVVVGEPGGGL